jgi:hypothetical protein
MIVCYLSLVHLSQSSVLSKSRLENYDSYIDLAVQIFQAQNPNSIEFLKDFLTCLPSPIYIEQILILALDRLAKTDFDSCYWLVDNYNLLMPELDLLDLVKKLVRIQLNNNGLISGQDFEFKEQNQLYIVKSAKKIFWQPIDRAIVKTQMSQRWLEEKKDNSDRQNTDNLLSEVEISLDPNLLKLLKEKILLIRDLQNRSTFNS